MALSRLLTRPESCAQANAKAASGRADRAKVGRAQVAQGAKADGKRIGPSGFGVRTPSAAFERFVAAKAVEGHRTPGRWRVGPRASLSFFDQHPVFVQKNGLFAVFQPKTLVFSRFSRFLSLGKPFS